MGCRKPKRYFPIYMTSFSKVVLSMFMATCSSVALSAQTVTINFDPPSAPGLGVALSSEYQSQGVIFGAGPGGSGYRTAFIEKAAILNPPAPAHSGTQVAFIEQSRCHGDIRVNEAWGRFTQTTGHVQVYARELQSAAPYSVTLEGWAAGSNLSTDGPTVSQTQTVGMTGWTLLSISRRQQDIAFFRISSAVGSECTAIDDLSYDVPAVSAPDFSIIMSDPNGVWLPSSSSALATFTIHRFNGSTGNISLSANLPPGIGWTFTPNPTSGNEGSFVNLTIVSGDVPPSQSTATVTAAPVASAGASPHTLNFQLLLGGERSANSPLKVKDVSPDSPYGGSTGNGGSDSAGRILALAMDPKNDAILYAASEYAGVWKSVNGAVSWTQSSFGLRTGITQNDLSLAVDGNNSNRLLYATPDDDGRIQSLGGLWVSQDAASSWQHVRLCSPGSNGTNITSVIFASGRPFVASSCGIWTTVSDNLADGTWETIPTPPFSLSGAIVVGGPSKALFACQGAKVFRSLNLGATAESWVAGPDLPGACWRFAVAPIPHEFVPDTVVVIHQVGDSTTYKPEVSIVRFCAQCVQGLGFTTVGLNAGSCCGAAGVFTPRRASATSNETRPGWAYDIYASTGFYSYLFDPDTNSWDGLPFLHADTWSMAFPSIYDPANGSCIYYTSNDGGVYQHAAVLLPAQLNCEPHSQLASTWMKAGAGLHVMYSGTMAGISQPPCLVSFTPLSVCPTLYLPTGDNDVWVSATGGASWSLLGQPSLGDAGQTYIDPAIPTREVSSRGGGNKCMDLVVSVGSHPPWSGDLVIPPNSCFSPPAIFSGRQPPNMSGLSQVMTLVSETAPSEGQYVTVTSPARLTPDGSCNPAVSTPDTILISLQQDTQPVWRDVSPGAHFGPCQIGGVAVSGGITNPTIYVITAADGIYPAGPVHAGQVWKGQVINVGIVGVVRAVATWSPLSSGLIKGVGLFANPYSLDELYVTDIGSSPPSIKAYSAVDRSWHPQSVLTDIATNHGEFRVDCLNLGRGIIFGGTCSLSGMAFPRLSPDIRVAAMYPGGLAFSRDGGANWIGLDVTNNLPRQCPLLGPCTLSWDLIEYPISVFYDDPPQTNVRTIFMALNGNSVKRVDGPFATLQSLSLAVCETCLNLGTTLRPRVSSNVSAVFGDIKTTVSLRRGPDGVFRGQLLFDSSKVSKLTFHFVADGKSTPELSHFPSAAEINSGTTAWRVLNPCPTEWAALHELQGRIAVLQGQVNDPAIPEAAKKAIGVQLRGLDLQFDPAQAKLRVCVAPSN